MNRLFHLWNLTRSFYAKQRLTFVELTRFAIVITQFSVFSFKILHCTFTLRHFFYPTGKTWIKSSIFPLLLFHSPRSSELDRNNSLLPGFLQGESDVQHRGTVLQREDAVLRLHARPCARERQERLHPSSSQDGAFHQAAFVFRGPLDHAQRSFFRVR